MFHRGPKSEADLRCILFLASEPQWMGSFATKQMPVGHARVEHQLAQQQRGLQPRPVFEWERGWWGPQDVKTRMNHFACWSRINSREGPFLWVIVI